MSDPCKHYPAGLNEGTYSKSYAGCPWCLVDALAASLEKAQHALAVERGKLEAADAENDRLAARVAELEKDAERFRWLRNDSKFAGPVYGTGEMVWPVIGVDANQCEPIFGEELDDAVDAAIASPYADGNTLEHALLTRDPTGAAAAGPAPRR